MGIQTFEYIVIFYTRHVIFSNVWFLAKINLIYCLVLIANSKINYFNHYNIIK